MSVKSTTQYTNSCRDKENKTNKSASMDPVSAASVT